MAFTQVTLTGTVTLSNLTPANGATVVLRLSNEISDGTQNVYPQSLTVRTNSMGEFSLAVNANDDNTTLPAGTYYSVTVTYGGQSLDQFKVIVPEASAPSVDLFSLARLGTVPTAASTFVSSLSGLNGALQLVSPDDSITIDTESNEAEISLEAIFLTPPNIDGGDAIDTYTSYQNVNGGNA